MKLLARAGPVRGAPLAMMAIVLTAWIGGRALVWESPFRESGALLPDALAFSGETPPAVAGQGALPREPGGGTELAAPLPAAVLRGPPRSRSGFGFIDRGVSNGRQPRSAAGPGFLERSVARAAPGPVPQSSGRAGAGGEDYAPFLAPVPPATGTKSAGRWSLDVWGFWRQGSDAAPISQGRVPIYGASQTGAVLQYRLAPENARDPRLHARAYRALVRRGESELALGASARPLPRVPVRVFGEVRFTDGAFRSETRPSAFAVTEIAPIGLPLGTRFETYAQAGWVGGVDDTLFADGQASLTREIGAVARASDKAVRFSVGVGAWGGAQEGAHRLDLGPTMRLDMTLGEVPARLSVDWRERVEGDAGPDSGLAMTLSTRF